MVAPTQRPGWEERRRQQALLVSRCRSPAPGSPDRGGQPRSLRPAGTRSMDSDSGELSEGELVSPAGKGEDAACGTAAGRPPASPGMTEGRGSPPRRRRLGALRTAAAVPGRGAARGGGAAVASGRPPPGTSPTSRPASREGRHRAEASSLPLPQSGGVRPGSSLPPAPARGESCPAARAFQECRAGRLS